MAPKSKRRTTQRSTAQNRASQPRRSQGLQGRTTGTGGSVRTPPTSRKRSAATSQEGAETGRQAPKRGNPINSRPSEAVRISRDTPPSVPCDSPQVHRAGSPPPLSRPSGNRAAFVPSNATGMAVARGIAVRTAQTPSDSPESEDRDVLPVPRLPLDQNPFFNRFVALDSDACGAPRINNSPDEHALCPVTPGHGRRSGPGSASESNGQAPRRSADHTRREHGPAVSNEEAPVRTDLQSFSATRDMLSPFYEDLKNLIKSEVSALRQFFSSKLHEFETEQGRMSLKIGELRVIVSSGRGAMGSQSRPTPLSKYEMKLDECTPHGDWVFDLESMCKTLRMNLPHTILSVVGERGNVVDNVSNAVKAILFGLLPSQKRAAFLAGVGRRHSAFRYNVVLNILANVQHNRFGRFSTAQIGAAAPVPPHHEPGGQEVLQIPQPEWLQVSFIQKKHVEEARKRLESNAGTPNSNGRNEERSAGARQRRSWLTVKETPDREDIAKYSALKAYRCVTTALYYAREKAKWVLFEELLYITSAWDDDDSDVDQTDLRVWWAHEDDDTVEIDLHEVPSCKQISHDPAHANDENTSILAEFLSARKEMILLVSHFVKIRPSGTSVRQRRRVEERVLERSINLVDVASKFCVVFTEQSMGAFSTLPFLGAHPHSLKCIYAVALLLRRVVETYMLDYIVNGSYDAPDVEERSEVECHGIKLDALLPAASVRKRLSNSRCLRMTSEEYDKIHVPGNEGNRDVHNTDGDAGEVEIDPLNTDGVMLL